MAILRYNCITREVPFADFWRMRCEEDFTFSLKAFCMGVPLFMCTLAQIGWVSYYSIPSRNIAASIITGVAVVTLAFWFLHTERKWGDFLMGGSEVQLYDPGPMTSRGRGGRGGKGGSSGGGDEEERIAGDE